MGENKTLAIVSLVLAWALGGSGLGSGDYGSGSGDYGSGDSPAPPSLPPPSPPLPPPHPPPTPPRRPPILPPSQPPSPNSPPEGVTTLDFFASELSANNLGGEARVPERPSTAPTRPLRLTHPPRHPFTHFARPHRHAQGPNFGDPEELRYSAPACTPRKKGPS